MIHALLMGLVLLQSPAAPQPEPGAAPDYPIGAEDLLEIEVFQLDELTKTVRVAQDGSISYPLVGTVQVAGLTRSQLEARLAELLEQRFIRNPQVTVFIKEYRSRRVAVIGAVHRPDTYELVGAKRILDMLGMAGGVTEEAGKRLYLLRNGAREPFVIDLDELLREGRVELNFEVQAGDVVNVPKAETITIYVYGEVEDPGSFKVERDQPVTALQAVTMAGGLTRRASKSKTTIHRQLGGGQKQILSVNLEHILEGKQPDVLIEDGDTIVVPRSFF